MSVSLNGNIVLCMAQHHFCLFSVYYPYVSVPETKTLTLVDLNGKTKSDGVGAPGVTLTQGIMDKKHNSRHCCS